MNFQPDYNNILHVLSNKYPNRLPLYEHIIDTSIMEKVLNEKFSELLEGNKNDVQEFFRHYCRFFREMTYDTVSFEVCITETLPDHGAIMGGKPGPIKNRDDFDKFPWPELPDRYWGFVKNKFELLGESLPDGMKAIGGIGNGVFEISEDLVGFEYLSYMQVDDPELFSELFTRIGDLMVSIWKTFLEKYADHYCVCRFGDDLGFKTGTLLNPNTIIKYIVPQYKRVIELIHSYKIPFLWHSCGNIFEVMDNVIDIGINAKHSNEDAIAPFEEWIEKFNDRIGLLGGIDVDIICQNQPDDVFHKVIESGKRYRSISKGYALGSGNSIPDYVPVDGYLAMIKAAQYIRQEENSD